MQNMRKLILILSLLLFPITICYFSPYLIIHGALESVVSGSFIVFSLMFVLAIFFGRGFCAYLCPAGGLQEICFSVNNKPAKLGKRKYIKYVIWGIWIGSIAFCFWRSGGIRSVNPLYMTENGISIAEPMAYILYYGIVLLIIVPGLICGKRAFCHYFCWMAPFMVLGTKLRKVLHLPGLHIETQSETCINCKKCNKTCPMSLDVVSMVQSGTCEDSECILCGACVETCPKKVLRYSLTAQKRKRSK